MKSSVLRGLEEIKNHHLVLKNFIAPLLRFLKNPKITLDLINSIGIFFRYPQMPLVCKARSECTMCFSLLDIEFKGLMAQFVLICGFSLHKA